MIKYVIFDLDGTLLDTLTTIHHYINTTFASFGISGISREDCRRVLGKGARNLITRSLEISGVTDPDKVEQVFTAYMAAYDADPTHLTAPYDGIVELLTYLREQGLGIAVMSNKPEYSTSVLIRDIFGDLVDVIRGGREGIPLKPAPDGVLALLKELDCTPDECIYVGDSEVDVLTAEAFSPSLFAAVTWGFRTEEELRAVGACHFASTSAELKTLIDSHIAK